MNKITKTPDLQEIPELPDEIKNAALNGELVLFIGAGVSKLVGLPSWAELAWAVLNDLQKSNVLNFSELEQLKHLEPKKQLSIAEIIANENNIHLNLAKHFSQTNDTEDIYYFLNKIKCACVTTNYDKLLSPILVPTDDGSTTSPAVKRIVHVDKFYAAHLNSPGTVVHLHGAISQPSTMICTTKNYLSHYDDKHVQHFLHELFEKKIVLFIGYGLEEAELLEHILRRGTVSKEQRKRRFALQGFFKSEEPLYKNLHKYYMESFGVNLIGFVRDYNDYGQLKKVIKVWSKFIEIRPTALEKELDFMEEVLGGNEFGVKEEDLLYRIENKPELQSFFFQKIRGFHWFDPLLEKGFFNPEKNPKPVPVDEEGFMNIPYWSALDYLVATSSSLDESINKEYTTKFLKVLRDVTEYARSNAYGNYHTWWQFTKIISHLPIHLINEDDLEMIDYWLDDRFERGLTAESLCENWLPKLLVADNDNISFGLRLLDKIFTVRFVKEHPGSDDYKKAQLKFSSWYAEQIIEKMSRFSGQKLHIKFAKFFESKLVTILDRLQNDSWSSFWRSAIEPYDQNHGADDIEDIFINACCNFLLEAIEQDIESSVCYIKQLLLSKYQTLKRLAIYVIDQKFDKFNDLIDFIIVKEHFSENLRHEVWHFLNRNYLEFQDLYKKKILDIIENINIYNDDGSVNQWETAFNRSKWLSAIKDIDSQTTFLYKRYIGITGNEPEHPDFSLYISVEKVTPESPISIDYLLSLEIGQLPETLNKYKKSKSIVKLDIIGLASVFKTVIKFKASEISLELERFINIDPTYIYEIIEAFRDLWNEKRTLNWKEIWTRLLEYCEKIVNDERFFPLEYSQMAESFILNRNRLVSAIAHLIEDGTKSDEHAFEPDIMPKAKEILNALLKKQKGSEFKLDGDAVSVAINSPRGSCIEAMINHTLRSCRLKGKNKKRHEDVWRDYEPIYNDELKRTKISEYEFATLVTKFLPNFLYMSKEWVLKNLINIFDQSDYQRWLCAIQGYAYSVIVIPEIYMHLKNNGDFVKVLDDVNLNIDIKKKFIEVIVAFYVHGNDSLKNSDSLIFILLERGKYEELSHLIWFVWTLHKKNKPDLSFKAFELWPALLQKFNFKEEKDRKLASSLCDWVIFIDEITDINRNWLLKIAPFAHISYKVNYVLEHLALISNAQPLEAQIIWLKMLNKYSDDYPEKSIKQILTNLIKMGSDGKRKAIEIIDAYIKFGNEKPRNWFKEIEPQMNGEY